MRFAPFWSRTSPVVNLTCLVLVHTHILCAFSQRMTVASKSCRRCVNRAQEGLLHFCSRRLQLLVWLGSSARGRKRECGSVFQQRLVTWQEGWALCRMTHLYRHLEGWRLLLVASVSATLMGSEQSWELVTQLLSFMLLVSLWIRDRLAASVRPLYYHFKGM